MALKLTLLVQPLLQWLMGCLQNTVPGIPILGALNMEYRLTNRRRNTLQNMVPEAPPQTQAQTTYAMQVATRPPPPQTPTDKSVTLSKRWGMQKLYLY